MGGALVRYGPEVAVTSLWLPSDFSAARVFDLPEDSTQKKIQKLIAAFGEVIPLAGGYPSHKGWETCHSRGRRPIGRSTIWSEAG